MTEKTFFYEFFYPRSHSLYAIDVQKSNEQCLRFSLADASSARIRTPAPDPRNGSERRSPLFSFGRTPLHAPCGAGSLEVGKRGECVFQPQRRRNSGVRDAVSIVENSHRRRSDRLCIACENAHRAARVWTLLDTGLRVGELCALPRKRPLAAAPTPDQGKGGAHGKKSKVRVVRCRTACGCSWSTISRWRRRSGQDPACPGHRQGGGKPRGISKDVSPHVLRHTFARRLAEGISLPTVRRSWATTVSRRRRSTSILPTCISKTSSSGSGKNGPSPGLSSKLDGLWLVSGPMLLGPFRADCRNDAHRDVERGTGRRSHDHDRERSRSGRSGSTVSRGYHPSTIFPSRSRMMRSASAATSGLWVTTMRVSPRSRRSRLRRLSTSSWETLSRFPVGSSARSKLGSLARERAIATRCVRPRRVFGTGTSGASCRPRRATGRPLVALVA